MFKKRPDEIEKTQDFGVSLVDSTANSVRIRIGPRFRPQIVAGFNFGASLDGSDVQGGGLPSFYCPESVESAGATILYNFLKDRGRLTEFSKYYPLAVTADETLNQRILRGVNGGTFEVQKGIRTFFWMKLVTGVYNSFNTSKLETDWPRIEFGQNIPKNGTAKYTNGVLSYNTYLPFMEVTPSQFSLNLVRYDCGQVRYYSDANYDESTGTRRDNIFNFGKVSEFFS